MNNANEPSRRALLDAAAIESLVDTAPVRDKALGVFPPWHKRGHVLPAEDPSMLYSRELTCPACGSAYRCTMPRESKLVKTGEDSDLRQRYKGVEPIYHAVPVCPDCLFAAPLAYHQKPLKHRDELAGTLAHYRPLVSVKADRDADDVFTSYYLALKCSAFYPDREMLDGWLWQRLSRVYDDCGDLNMSLFALRKAYKAYQTGFSVSELSSAQLQRTAYAIGDMAARLGEYDKARRFLFETKKIRDGAAAIRDMADQRLEYVNSKL
ncbi:MAG: DUF2225 domain-containing protein [Synergistaceae bacterium]|jgi:uncharacterized protein (DUF2225 family)|nr:DUF2225 domain-containing protein [Synergistaceae bacterium]